MADNPAVLDVVQKALKESTESIAASNQKATNELQQSLTSVFQNALLVQQKEISKLSAKVESMQASGSGGGGVSSSDSISSPKSLSARKSNWDILRQSMASSSNSTMKYDGDSSNMEESLDPLKVGDELVLSAEVLNNHGFLHGDLASHRVGVQQSDEETNREALNFTDYVFRVCPMLNYRQRNELDIAQIKAAQQEQKELKAAASGKSSKKAKKARKSKELVADAGIKLLRTRVQQEEAGNAEVMASVVAGNYQTKNPDMKYGDMFQLQHIKSGAFLSVVESAAPYDPECRGVILDAKGSSACLFKFMPHFKAQSVGSIIYYSHSVRLESVKQKGYLVHVSPITYSDIPDWRRSDLPKSLQTGKIFETNLATVATAFNVTKYSRYNSKHANILRTSDYFRLYHNQSESFVQASSDPEKDRRNNGLREGDDPSHIPFLKKLPDLGETPDPTNPKHQVPKSVWCFEALKRSSTKVISWGTSVRVRHVPSGRYLAVDSEADPVYVEEGGQNEKWFRTYLVDDAVREEDLSQNIYDVDTEAELGFKIVPAASLVFTVSAADVTSSAFVPSSNTALRLEHSCEDGTMLYLHNTEERKPIHMNRTAAGTVIARSFRLVFSSLRSAQDIFKLMRLAPNECHSINIAASLRRPCDLYSCSLKDPDVPMKQEFMKETMRVLLKIFAMQVKGDHHFDENFDWIGLANSMLPAAYSARFTGEPDLFVQRICRDMKIMDSVFSMGVAPYLRTAQCLGATASSSAVVTEGGERQRINPWTPEGVGNLSAQDMLLPKGIQKMVHVALQLAFNGNIESQIYFSNRVSAGIQWMDTIFEQLDDALGSAVTLSRLLSSHADIMKRYAEPKLVHRFLQMIRDLGPEPRLVNFFEAVCTTDGVAVKANQEMILRLTWMNEENKRKAYLYTQSFDVLKAGPSEPLKTFSPVQLPSGVLSDGKQPKNAAAKYPAEYIGKEVFERESSFDPVFIRWIGHDNWTPKMDELFWSPKALMIPTYDFGRDGRPEEVWCRIEEVCWVLEPERLCEAITGTKWEDMMEQLAQPGSGASIRMSRQIQIADFYVGQLTMIGKLCSGRSYNCIAWMEKSFSYEMLCCMCYNVHLPAKVRSAACAVVQSLYLDRFPQLIFCGKPKLPEELWVYDLSENKDKVDVLNVPLIKDVSLAQPGALAEFAITPSHKMYKDPNQFYGFSSGFKFFLLRNLCNQYLSTFGSGSVCHAELNENTLASSICAIITGLMNFGFQSSLVKIKDLLGNLAVILDGRNDCDAKGMPFFPPESRFKLTPVSPKVTQLKSSIIDILFGVSNLRANFRLAKLMQIFKEYNSNRHKQIELKKIHLHVLENKMDRYESDFTSELFFDFEDLFTNGDGAALDLGKLSNQNMDIILLDCLMYDDDKLFAKALTLLDRTYGQRSKLIESLGEVTLLHNEQVPVFGNVADMNSEIGYMTYLMRSAQVWGVSSRVSGPFGKEKYQQVLKTCERINEFLLHSPIIEQGREHRSASSALAARLFPKGKGTTGAGGGGGLKYTSNPIVSQNHDGSNEDGTPTPFTFHQDVLRSLSTHTTLIEALNIDYNLAFKGSICSSEDKIESRRILVEVQGMLIKTLGLFVKGNERNQNVIFKHLARLRKHLGPLKMPSVWPSDFSEADQKSLPTHPGMDTEEVIIECCRNNWYLCDAEVPRDLMEDFGFLLENEPDPSESYKLDLFTIMCQPSPFGRTLPRNQEVVVDVLLSDSLPGLQKVLEDVFSTDKARKHTVARPDKILRVLTAAILDGNLICAAKLQAKRFTIDGTIRSLELLTRDLIEGKELNRLEEEDVIFNNEHFCALVEFLAGQLDVLALDPKIFRMEETWYVLTIGINRLLSAMVRNETSVSDKTAQCTACACRAAFVFIDGARSLGLQELQMRHRADLIDSDDSVARSARLLAGSPIIRKFSKTSEAAATLSNLISPNTGSYEAIGVDDDDDDDDEDEEEEEEDMYGDFSSPPSPGALAVAASDGGVELTTSSLSGGGNMDIAATRADMKRRETITEQAVVSGDDEALLKEFVPVGTMREYFFEAVKNNSMVVKKLVSRKFEMIRVLENAFESTGRRGAKNGIKGADGEGSVSITWDKIMARMVNYLKEHNYDWDESVCLLILKLFRFHLLKARSDEVGNEIDLHEMKTEQLEQYKAKQASFVDFNVIEVALTAIATHPANVEGNLADEAIELLLEMMKGGNQVVQEAVYNYIETEDRDNKFLNHIKTRMDHSLIAIRERKHRTANKFYNMTDQNREEFKNCEQTFQFMQEMCEGHYLQNQEIFRAQSSSHSSNVNLVVCAAEIFMAQCEASPMLTKMEEAEVDLMIVSLEMLTELVQGPCAGNQDLLVGLDGLAACLDKVIQSNFHRRIGVAKKLQVKAAALQLIASCLEDRNNLRNHHLLAKELDPEGFELFRAYACNFVNKFKRALSQERISEEEYDQIENITLDAFSSVSIVTLQLQRISTFAKKAKLLGKKKKGAKTDLLDKEITTIEISWNDRIEQMSFPIPKDADYLTIKTRDEFLQEADLSTAEKRMKQLIDLAPLFMAEMQQIYTLSQWSKVYLFIHHNIVNIKWSMYALVVLLNLNIMMASYGEGSEDGYPSIRAGMAGLDKQEYATSLYISLILAVINLVGYIVIVAFLAITEVPIIIRQLDDYVEECIDSISMRESDYRDPGAFTWWVVTLIFNVLFIIMHLSNYPGKENQGLYLFLVLGINLPWTLSCVRNYIVVPNTPQTRIFCVAYDVLITKPFFRNHVILMVCSINGFTQSTYFPLMLMDIMNNSRVLANVARSVTDNMTALALVFYLFVCTVAIYAQFGLEYFEDWFVYGADDDEEDPVACHSVVSCFVLIFYSGVPNGSLADVMRAISNRHTDVPGQDSNTYLQRVIFDLSFFIWVGILLFNIITGLMVDGFGSLREEDNERKDILENTCFVCGFTRSVYDDIPNFRGPNFDYHKNNDHDFWTYVYFYVYLKRKDKTTFSGAESYVWRLINDHNLSWIPTRNSAAIQNYHNELDEDNDGKEGEIDPKLIEKMAEDMVALKSVVGSVEKKLKQTN